MGAAMKPHRLPFPAFALALLAGVALCADEPAPLTTCAEVRALSSVDAAKARPARLSGVVTFATQTPPLLFVQDDTGVPLTYFDQSKWTLEPYGNYVPPISIFSQRYQPKMRELFVKAKAPKIDFGIGYRHRPNETGLLVARKKS